MADIDRVCAVVAIWSERDAAAYADSDNASGAASNDLWCADFKGEFKLCNGRYC